MDNSEAYLEAINRRMIYWENFLSIIIIIYVITKILSRFGINF